MAEEITPVPPAPAEPAGDREMNKDARTWGMLAHLSGFAGYIIPMGSIVGPLVVWLVKKNEYPFVDDQGKEALNFQITMLIGLLVCIPLIFVCIGIPLMIALGVLDIVFCILGAIKANEGVRYRYPFALRLIT